MTTDLVKTSVTAKTAEKSNERNRDASVHVDRLMFRRDAGYFSQLMNQWLFSNRM